MLAIILGIFPGCLHFKAKEINPTETAQEFQTRTLQDRNLLEFIDAANQDSSHAPSNEAFIIWDLNRLTLAALFYNAELKLARTQWQAAFSQIDTAGQSPNPTMIFFPQFISNPKNLPSWAYTFDLVVTIETAGKRELRVSQATANAEAIRYQIEQVSWTLRSKIRDAMLVIFKTKKLQFLNKEEAKLLKSEHEILAERAKNAYIAPQQKLDSEVLLSRNELRNVEAERQILEAKANLASAIGVPAIALNDIELDLRSFEKVPALSKEFLIGARERALKGRFTILSALASYSASSAALELEVAKQYPDIRFGPSYIWNQGVNKWGLGLTSLLPVVNQNQGPIHDAEAKREESSAKFAAIQEQAIGEIELREIGYRSSLKTLRASEEVLSALMAQEKSINKLLRPGDISRPLVLRSNLNLISAESAKLDSLIQAQSALGSLENALQIPLLESTLTQGSH